MAAAVRPDDNNRDVAIQEEIDCTSAVLSASQTPPTACSKCAMMVPRPNWMEIAIVLSVSLGVHITARIEDTLKHDVWQGR